MGMGNIANTGMQAAMMNMEVIGHNIANNATPGFKSGYVNFADIYPAGASTTAPGLGVRLVNVQQNFNNGGYTSTGIESDLSINRNGFFILKDANSGQLSYTRSGHFDVDNQGFFTVGSNRLQGFPAQNNVIIPGSTPADIQLNYSPLAANASTTIQQVINLDSNSVIPTTTPFDENDPSTFNYETHANLFDSLGNANNVNIYYTKTSANNWDVNVLVNNTAVGTGALVFNQNGSLNSSTGLNALSFATTSGAVSPQVFSLDLVGSTQVASPSTAQPAETDGYPAGVYQAFNVDNNGVIKAVYSNGKEFTMGQVALANFQAPESLAEIGNMSWIATTGSGAAIIDPRNSSNNLSSQTLELSNVDLTEQMVNLIGAQHSFEANARVEQVYNEIMKTVDQL